MAVNRTTQRISDAVTQSDLITVALMKALGLQDEVNVNMSVKQVAEMIGDALITSGEIVIDDELSTTSKHPVQNKVITSALEGKVDILYEAPTQDNDADKLSIVVLNEQPTTKYKGYIYAIQNAEQETLNALYVGQEIRNGLKYHFDTSKEAELLAYLESLTYEEGSCTLATYTTSEQYIVVYHQDNAYILVISDGGANFVYTNVPIPEMEITTAGFQNLDANDDYVITWPVGVEREITSLIPSFSQINGSIIGTQSKVEGSYTIYYGNNEIATLDNVYSKAQADNKFQDKLVSGSNIKTIGGESILGAGNITKVPLADNLYSADSQTDVSEFIVRTSGGDVSIDTGEATLVRMEGNSTIPIHVADSITMNQTEVPRLSGSVDLATWQTSDIGTTSGTYTFTYDDTQESWTFNGEAVSLSTYGISISGTPIANDRIIITYTYDDADPTQSIIDAEIQESQRFSYGLNYTTWKSYVQSSGEYDFTYDGSDWKLGGGMDAFVAGTTILHNGDKIRFNKSANWASILSGLTYDEGTFMFLGATNNFYIYGLDCSSLGQTGYALFVNITDENYYFVYATDSGSYGSLSWTQGWNDNLVDANGDFTIITSDTHRVERLAPGLDWNGTLIGLSGSAQVVDLTNYGITITGTPISGDEINIDYTKKENGTIYNATPTSFKSIGFNLYDHTTGFARVVGNEDGQWYNVKGTYTKIEFSTSMTGTFTEITPTTYTIGSYSTNSGFAIYEDGYIKVTGGNDTDTMINLIWSGYMIDAQYQAYTEDSISIPTIDANSQALPTELCSIGETRDIINFDLLTWIKKIDKVAYSDATLEQLINEHPTWVEGRDYEWDSNYIYIVSATPTTYQLSSTLSGIYEVDDFGIEEVLGTNVAVKCAILYGQNLKDKLRRDVLTIGPQSLTQEQKEQVWANLGLLPIGNTEF